MTAPFATCDFCDAFKADTSGDFRVLPPVFRDFGGRQVFCGPVQTVQCLDDNSRVKEAVESPGWVDTPAGRVGKVLVVDGGASLRKALLGGQPRGCRSPQRLGWCARGWLCARRGRARAARLLVSGLWPSMPLPTDRRQQGVADVPVRVQGVWVRPGDWLYADRDGIVVSPRPLL